MKHKGYDAFLFNINTRSESIAEGFGGRKTKERLEVNIGRVTLNYK